MKTPHLYVCWLRQVLDGGDIYKKWIIHVKQSVICVVDWETTTFFWKHTVWLKEALLQVKLCCLETICIIIISWNWFQVASCKLQVDSVMYHSCHTPSLAKLNCWAVTMEEFAVSKPQNRLQWLSGHVMAVVEQNRNTVLKLEDDIKTTPPDSMACYSPLTLFLAKLNC